MDKAKSSPKQEITTSCILLNISNKKFSRREIEIERGPNTRLVLAEKSYMIEHAFGLSSLNMLL